MGSSWPSGRPAGEGHSDRRPCPGGPIGLPEQARHAEEIGEIDSSLALPAARNAYRGPVLATWFLTAYVALIGWVVLVRYRVLVPLMIGLAFLEQLGRFGVGQLKPIEAAGTPPGAIGTWIPLPLALLFFVVSIVGRPDSED